MQDFAHLRMRAGLDVQTPPPAEVAKYTVRTMLRSIPPAVPGIHFLSGARPLRASPAVASMSAQGPSLAAIYRKEVRSMPVQRIGNRAWFITREIDINLVYMYSLLLRRRGHV